MGGQRTDEEQASLVRAEELVESIGATQLQIQQNELDFEAVVRPYKEHLATKNDPLVERRETELVELATIMERLIASPNIAGKSIPFRSGVVSVRTTNSLEVIDETRLMKLARRLGIVRLVSEAQPRKVKKTMIAQLLKKRPDLVALLSSVIEQKRTARMTVKPIKVQSELTHDMHPLRVALTEPS